MRLKKYFKYLSVFIIICCLHSCSEAPTDAPALVSGVSGSVTSKTNNNALSGASIVTIPSSKSTTTDDNGNYELKDISPGTYTVKATKQGFNDATTSVIVEEGKTSRGDIQMMEEGPEIAVQPQSIDFGTSQQNATFAITNTGIGVLNFNITKNAAWLSVNPVSGAVTTNPVTINVTVNRSVVGYGNYSDVIQITSNGGNKQVNVTMTNQDPNAPLLVVSPLQLTFGATLSTLNLNISNGGAGNLNWTAAKDQNWIGLSTTSGTNVGVINVTVNRNGLPGGQNFSGNVIINSNGGNKTIPITMSTGLPYSGSWTTMTGKLAGINSQSNSILAVVNSNNLWVAGDKIWKYNGTQWSEQTKPSGISIINAISFSSANNGWAVGGGLMKYNGSYWTKINASIDYGCYVIAIDNNTVFVFNWYKVDKSFDGGQTWQTESFAGIGYDGMVRSADFSQNGNFVFAAFGGGDIIKYDGLGWSRIASLGSGNYTEYLLNSVSVVNSTNAWLAHNNASGSGSKIYKFNGSGLMCEFTATGLDNINSISMISPVNGWAGGSKLYQYSGTEWVVKSGSLGSEVIAIKMVSENEGYAVTASGGILKYQ